LLKKTILIILLLSFLGCSHFKLNHVAVNIGYGKDTKLGNLSKVKKGDSYNISTFSVEFIEKKKWSKSIEFNIIDHKYVYVNNNKYYNDHSTSYTVKAWLIKNFRFKHVDIFTGLGAGFGYMNSDNNRYVYDSKLVSDLGIRFGLQKSFEPFDIRIEYMFRHFSAIWKDDKGENEDEIRFGVVIPF